MEEHAHYWILDPKDFGKCKICGEEKQFEGQKARDDITFVDNAISKDPESTLDLASAEQALNNNDLV